MVTQAATGLALWRDRLTKRLAKAQDEISERGDRSDGPIPTVIIILATVAGALLIAGTLAVLYSKADGKLSGFFD